MWLSQIFCLVECLKGDLTVLGLSFVDEEVLELSKLALEAPCAPLTQQQASDRHEMVLRRLSGCCKGLLEIPDAAYIHSDPESYPDSQSKFHPYPDHIVRPGDMKVSTSWMLDRPLSIDAAAITLRQSQFPPIMSKVTYFHRTAKDFLQSRLVKDETTETAGCYDPNFALFCSTLLLAKVWEASPASGKTALEYASAMTDPTVLDPALLDELDRVLTTSYDMKTVGVRSRNTRASASKHWASECHSMGYEAPQHHCSTWLRVFVSTTS